MNKGQSSATAKGTAAVRAIESQKPATERICYDPLARKLTTRLSYFLIKLFARYGERRTHGALTFIACRCRYIDDYIEGCIASGIEQLVIMGAGLDSRAYRTETIQQLGKVFEVDHPATQANKVKRITEVFGKAPVTPVYVPIDFDSETMDKLLVKGFNKSLQLSP